MKKLIALLLSVILVASTFAGCSSSDNEGTEDKKAGEQDITNEGGDSASEDVTKDRPYEGVEITYAGEAGGIFTEFYKRHISDFTEATGIKVSFFEVAHENTHERFLTEAMGGTGSIDVYQLDQPWVAEFADLGYLEEITDDTKAEIDNFSDFSEAALETMTYNNTLYGLPFQYHTPVLFYRTDLFEAAGLTEPPKTWDEYREYAKILNDPDNGIYGTSIEAKAVPEPATHFLDKMAQAGAHYMDENGNAIFDSPETREAIQFLYNLQNVDKTSPEGAIGYDNTDVYNLFMQGKIAMVSEWPYFYAGSQDPEQSLVVGKVGVAAQPAGKYESSALWTFGHGVSVSSKQKEAALEFVKWSVSPEILAKLSIEETTPVPRSSANELVYASSELSEDTKNVLKVIADASNKARNYTTTPNFPAVQLRLATTLSNIITGLKTMDEEVAATQKDLESILAQ